MTPEQKVAVEAFSAALDRFFSVLAQLEKAT
jgi:hypothetical protein